MNPTQAAAIILVMACASGLASGGYVLRSMLGDERALRAAIPLSAASLLGALTYGVILWFAA